MDSTSSEPIGTDEISTPSNRPSISMNKMSASLKEKLRKLGRYHGNTPSPSVSSSAMNKVIAEDLPVTPVLDRAEIRSSAAPPKPCQQRRPYFTPQLKRKLVVDEDDGQIKKKAYGTVALQTRPVISTELRDIRQKIDEREDELRKLRLVKLYRTKNNLDELACVIEKWRTACQQAVTALWEKSKAASDGFGPSSIAQLLGYLRIDPDLVRYNTEDEDFY